MNLDQDSKEGYVVANLNKRWQLTSE